MRHGKRSRNRGHRPLVDPLFAEELESGRGFSSSGRSGRRSSENHKTLALCRQAQRALSLSLGGECGDDVLNSLYVEAVQPAPDATHLLVRVVVPARVGVPISEVLTRLERVRGLLRAAVAQAITRKRAPELSFLPIAEAEVQP
jgi:ribosome-binding factor A